MLLTRFWNVFVSLVLGAAVFVLYLAVSMYNRAGGRTMAERLSSDSQVVSWYLKEDAQAACRRAHPVCRKPRFGPRFGQVDGIGCEGSDGFARKGLGCTQGGQRQNTGGPPLRRGVRRRSAWSRRGSIGLPTGHGNGRLRVGWLSRRGRRPARVHP